MDFLFLLIITNYIYPGVLLVFTVILALLVYIVVSSYRLKKKYQLLSYRHEKVKRQKEELEGLNQLKTKLFSVIAHDLRTPFIGLRNMVTLFKYNMPDDSEVPVFLDHISEDLSNKARLLDNLLHWSRSQLKGFIVDPVSIDINAIFEEIVQSFSDNIERKTIRVINKLGPGSMAFADLEMVKVIVRNLVGNALKFTPENGEVYVSQENSDKEIAVAIRDTGKGMSVEAVNRLFRDDFYSTADLSNKKGTGLGLLLCKEFVERNNGRIWVESTEGEGSTFYFTLPAYDISRN